MNQQDSTSYEEARRLIRKAMVEHRLVLFVGSGTSLDAGMPGWWDVISEIAGKLGIQANDADTLKIPQYYFNMYGKHNYTEFMRKIFKYRVPLHPGKVHDLILQFDAHTVITTNYDNLLEQAAEKRGEILYVVGSDEELPYKHGKELIKMHGDFEHNNFVLREDDYLNYKRRFKLINNYITSLAGTNLLLFIGYSFSDPDVKQIFSWLKNALGDDLQQAYMINVGTPDPVVDDYFRKFGINVMYARQIVARREVELSGKVSKTKSLEETLSWILEDNDYNMLEDLYQKLGPYQYMEAPYVTDIKDVLTYFGFNFDESSFSVSESKQVEGEIVIDDLKDETFGKDFFEQDACYTLVNPICGHDWKVMPDVFNQKQGISSNLVLYLKFCYIADQLAGKYPDAQLIHRQDWYQVMDEAFQKEVGEEKFYAISKDENKQIRGIFNVIGKAGFSSLTLRLPIDEKKLDGKPENTDIPWQECCIPLPVKKKRSLVETVMDCFDYRKLEKIEDRCENQITRNDADDFLKEAHICYFLGNGLKAYHFVKMAADRYYHQPNYAKYFIAKCDQYYIGDMLTRRGFWESGYNDELKNIKQEHTQIDLDRIFAGLPDLSGRISFGGTKNRFLKDLYSFQLAFRTLQRAIEEARKAKEEGLSNYIMYTGAPAYWKLRTQIYEFFRYQQRNHFLVDDYAEVKGIYELAVSSLLSSVLVKDRLYERDAVDPTRMITRNIHEKELRPFDLFLAVRFSSASEISKTLQGQDIIPVSNDGIQYLTEIIPNLVYIPKGTLRYQDYFQTVLALCGYITLSENLSVEILKMLIVRIPHGRYLRAYNDLIRHFLYHLGQQDWIKKTTKLSPLLCSVVDILAGYFQKQMEVWAIFPISQVCESALWVLKKCGTDYDHMAVVQQIFSGNANSNQTASMAIHIYPYASSQVKVAIKTKLSDWIPNEDVYGYWLYAVGIEYDIFTIDSIREESYYQLLESYQKEFGNHVQMNQYISKDRLYVNLIYELVLLARMGKFHTNERLKDICSSYSMKAAAWLLDPKDMRAFSDFEPRWLVRCGTKLLEKLSADTSMKKQINQRMKSEYGRGNLDDNLVKLYFTYFS